MLLKENQLIVDLFLDDDGFDVFVEICVNRKIIIVLQINIVKNGINTVLIISIYES
jgi:hypothetical protein